MSVALRSSKFIQIILENVVFCKKSQTLGYDGMRNVSKKEERVRATCHTSLLDVSTQIPESNVGTRSRASKVQFGLYVDETDQNSPYHSSQKPLCHINKE